MKFDSLLLVLTIIIGTGFHSLSRAENGPDPLFQSDDVLHVRLAAPLHTLLNERPDEVELPAVLEVTEGADAGRSFDIQVRTRGRYRRRVDICRFPPMRLNFKKSTTAETVFDQQDKLKLVTHCMPSMRYDQTVLREYAAYRILNELTDASFRVRLLRISYTDTENEVAEATRMGFVIEHRDRLANRLGIDVLDISETTAEALDSQHANLVSLFHYLIGNTDFSPIRGLQDERCCHNHVLFGAEGSAVFSVPYDFDQSGIVNAPYATPNLRFGLRNVRQRLYRGRCSNNEHISQTLNTYRSQRDAITTMLDSIPELEKKTKKELNKYVGEFFERFETDKRVKSTFIDTCI